MVKIGIIFFCNALNLGIGGDWSEHVICRVDNLSFPASKKYLIIHCVTNNIKFNNLTDIADGILCAYILIQFRLPNARISAWSFPQKPKLFVFLSNGYYTRYYFLFLVTSKWKTQSLVVLVL